MPDLVNDTIPVKEKRDINLITNWKYNKSNSITYPYTGEPHFLYKTKIGSSGDSNQDAADELKSNSKIGLS